jgi:hypothetical protein
VHGDNGKPWELPLEESFEVWKNVFIRPIGARVVVDDELIIGGVLRWTFVRRSSRQITLGMSFLIRLRIIIGVWPLQATDNELSRASDVVLYIRMHVVLAQHVDPEFLPGFGETQASIQCEDIGKSSTALVEVRHLEELEGGLLGTCLEKAVLSCAVIVIDTPVLLVECLIQNLPT